MRFARASAVTATVAMATIVGTASADLRPPVADGSTAAAASPRRWRRRCPQCPPSSTACRSPCSPRRRRTGSTTSCGSSPPSTPTRRQAKDRLHVDVSRPRETDTEGLKVPVIFEDSPYYAGGADVSELVGRPRARQLARRAHRAPYFTARAARARRSARSTSRTSCRAATPSCTPSRPARGHSDGCTDLRRANETLGATAVIDWLNGRAKGYTTRAGTTEVPRQLAQRQDRDDGHVLQRHDPDRRRDHGRRGPEAIVPVAAISDWYDYYRSNGLVRAPHSANGGQNGNNGYLGEDLDVLDRVHVLARRRAPGPRTKCWPIIDDDHGQARTSTRATATRPGTSATT